MQANILIFLESNYRSSLAKTVPLPLLPIEEIGIPLRSGLKGLNSTTVQREINPTDSVIPSFTELSKGRDQRNRSTTDIAFQKTPMKNCFYNDDFS